MGKIDYELEKAVALAEEYEKRFGIEPPTLMAHGDISICIEIMERCLKTGKPEPEEHPY